MRQDLIHTDGLVADTITGEILGYDDKPSAYATSSNCQPSLNNCRSVDDLNAFLGHEDVDRRKLPPHTIYDLTTTQDAALGEYFRSRKKVDYRISEPMMSTLKKLHRLVKYRNIIIVSQAGLAKALGTIESNLIKKLSTLTSANMVRISTSKQGKIRKREIKLTINPRLIFRGHEKLRDKYIKAWYQDWASKHPDSLTSENRKGMDGTTIAPAAKAA